VDLSGWAVGNCDCRCGILYALMLGGGKGMVFAGLLSLTSSPYSSELSVLGGGFWLASRGLLCVRVRRLGAFGFLWERENKCVKCRNG